jgi:REP element-mobilizing transposase RayT
MGQPHLISAKPGSGNKLFYEPQDFEGYLTLLADLSRQEIVQVYGFCLHPEELRLLVKPTQLSLARMMQRIHGSHTLRLNHKYGRHGPLFQARFESCILMEQQTLEALRNIHLWPVRKGIVNRAENYPWSSHRAYLGLDTPWNGNLQFNQIFEAFSDLSTVSRKAFARFVESAALDPEEPMEPAEPVLPRKSEMRRKRLSLVALAKRVALLLNVNTGMLSSLSRRQDLVMARRLFSTAAVILGARSITEVAKFLRRDKAQVSRLVSQGMDMVSKDEPFRLLLNSV